MASAAHLLLHSLVVQPILLPLLHSRAAALPSSAARFLSTRRIFSTGVPRRAPAMEASASRTRRGAYYSGDGEVATPRNKRIAAFDENLKKLMDEVFDVMYKTDGIGLSAPQVGLNVQLLVFNAAGERGIGEDLVFINPKVQKLSQKQVLFNEGCLLFPGICADVERPVSLKVDAHDISGEKFSISLSGLPARVFQHEFDHLEGVLFFERMTEEVLDSIRSELQALEKKYDTKRGLPSPERVDDIKIRKRGIGFGKKEAVGFGR